MEQLKYFVQFMGAAVKPSLLAIVSCIGTKAKYKKKK